MGTSGPISVKQILSPSEYMLYRRHIDDGMDFCDLAEEFGCGAAALERSFLRLEDKLREAFKQ